MKTVLFVFLGGGVGSCIRYFVSLALPTRDGSIPWATFAVNALGSFLISFIMQFYSPTLHDRYFSITEETRALLVIGVLGGFTTYSSFNNEMISLYRDGQAVAAISYAALTFVVCLVAGLAGVFAARPFV